MNRRDFLRVCGRGATCCAAWQALEFVAPLRSAQALEPKSGFIGRHLSPFFVPGDGGAVRCTLCPRGCEIASGQRGYCEVRENQGGKLYSLVYGNPCAVNVDPIEKKPFFHVLPGTRSFSLATAGCNFDCKFCQNYEISQARPEETMNFDLPPAEIAALASSSGSRSVASTYVEPTVFLEYILDIGREARAKKLLNVIHSNGYINPEPLDALCDVLDAACIDLKGITPAYYRDMTEGELEPVLATLEHLKRRGIHTELVTLIVPGQNDSPAELKTLSEWVVQKLGPATPLHFSRFYPQYKLTSLPPTPVKTLETAREIALKAGVQFVYVGNVPGHEAENTFCPACSTLCIQRLGYRVTPVAFADGKCAKCGHPIPGIWT